MLLRVKDKNEVASSEITPQAAYEAFRVNRRQMIAGLGAMGIAAALPARAFAMSKLNVKTTDYAVPDRATTPESKAQSYNNFYEFGTDKDEPAKNAGTLRVRPWTVQIEGLVKKPQTVDIDALIAYRPLEQRVYRFRCVEAWSMVIPWDGYPLAELIKFADPLPSAKYVQFLSLADKNQMRQIGSSGIDPPYSEGLRMDEAMNPLTLLTFGSYGETLANQQGAPVRVIVPWKYGFKSAKSIVKIRFLDKQPRTTWNELNSEEYGFYSNVNPKVDHPRWTQASERLLNTTGSLFDKRVPTLMFNGYSDQVASMYAGMDLKRYY
jgi:sulfoxide reductase catalytic subunit YedY